MSGLKQEDFDKIANVLNEQLVSDRKTINEAYEKIWNEIKDSTLRWVDLGEVFARILDLKLKQTNQVVEVMKTIQKMIPKDDFDGLSEEDINMIDKEIKK